jgi:hypothetical protein
MLNAKPASKKGKQNDAVGADPGRATPSVASDPSGNQTQPCADSAIDSETCKVVENANQPFAAIPTVVE